MFVKAADRLPPEEEIFKGPGDHVYPCRHVSCPQLQIHGRLVQHMTPRKGIKDSGFWPRDENRKRGTWDSQGHSRAGPTRLSSRAGPSLPHRPHEKSLCPPPRGQGNPLWRQNLASVSLSATGKFLNPSNETKMNLTSKLLKRLNGKIPEILNKFKRQQCGQKKVM